MKKGFDYIANENSRILILGTFPSEESRRVREYYGNKRNQFWKLLFETYNQKYNNEIEYSKKVEFLIKNNIALWDTVHSCLTTGSLDCNIKSQKYNDISGFISNYQKIEKIFCNGKTAYNFLKKQKLQIDIEILTSSSPTNTIKYENKLKIWKEKLKLSN